MYQLARNMNLKCVKTQIERQKFKLVITDVFTEGRQGTTWQTDSVLVLASEDMMTEA